MGQDLYAEAVRVADALAGEGLTSDADSLGDAIARRATGTEILMALRFHLRRIARSGVVSDRDTKSAMRDLARQIDRALR